MAQTEHKKQTLYEILCDVNIKTLEEKGDQNHLISPTSSVIAREIMELKNKFAPGKGPVLHKTVGHEYWRKCNHPCEKHLKCAVLFV